MTLKQWLELDARLSEHLRGAGQLGLWRTASVFLAHSGDSWFWGLGLGLLAWLGDSFWRSWAVTALISIVALAAVVLLVKFTIRRPRPQSEWGSIYRATDPHSFPSGHAARAFLLAVLALGLGPSWLAFLLSAWAPLVALARVVMGVHYLSDVLVGSLMGITAGFIVLGVIGAY